MRAQSLSDCPECQRRLVGKVPCRSIDVGAGEPLPAPDHCPVCGVEWPMLVISWMGRGDHWVLTPLSYDPVFSR